MMTFLPFRAKSANPVALSDGKMHGLLRFAQNDTRDGCAESDK
jgi:hypothetical protein